jgi:ribosomal subunit interface protein
MEVKFLFDNTDVSARTREYVRTRLGSVEKLLGGDAEASFIEVEISKDKRGLYRVEAMVKTPRTSYRSESVCETIEEATDNAEEEVKRQIRESKEKRKTLMKRGARSIKKKLTIDDSARF